MGFTPICSLREVYVSVGVRYIWKEEAPGMGDVPAGEVKVCIQHRSDILFAEEQCELAFTSLVMF